MVCEAPSRRGRRSHKKAFIQTSSGRINKTRPPTQCVVKHLEWDNPKLVHPETKNDDSQGMVAGPHAAAPHRACAQNLGLFAGRLGLALGLGLFCGAAAGPLGVGHAAGQGLGARCGHRTCRDQPSGFVGGCAGAVHQRPGWRGAIGLCAIAHRPVERFGDASGYRGRSNSLACPACGRHASGRWALRHLGLAGPLGQQG